MKVNADAISANVAAAQARYSRLPELMTKPPMAAPNAIPTLTATGVNEEAKSLADGEYSSAKSMKYS